MINVELRGPQIKHHVTHAQSEQFRGARGYQAPLAHCRIGPLANGQN